MDKLGLHVVEGYSGALGKPRLVKLVDVSPEYVQQVRAQVGPECLIIVRWVEKEQPLHTGSAAVWFGRRVAAMRAMNAYGPVAFESYNEIADNNAAAYCQFEVERLGLMHAAGLRAVVGNFSVGTPDLPVWATYRPMLNAMRAGDWLGLHEYWSSRRDLENPWHVGRWRLLPELAGIPIVVTECGRDVVEGQGASGWRRTCGADEFLADLRQYSALLAEFPRVRGGTVYGGGRIYPQWRDFEVNSIWEAVVSEYTNVSPKPGPQPEQPKPPKPVGPMLPIPGARVSQSFGANAAYYARYGQRGHNGVDLAAPNSADYLDFHGTEVRAVADGRAVWVWDEGGYGLYVYVYGDDADWLYAHLSEVLVAQNQRVRAGDVIGRVGYTGNTEPTGARGTHLHWGKRPKPYDLNNGYRGYVDPLG